MKFIKACIGCCKDSKETDYNGYYSNYQSLPWKPSIIITALLKWLQICITKL